MQVFVMLWYSCCMKETGIKVIAITGATATGKTKYSIELAQKLNGEIISADSRMIYKYYDIATAKPTIKERNGVVHHLIDIIEPEQDFSVAEFVVMAKNLCREITSRGKIPIIVGGTGLYFKVLAEDYNIPAVPANKELRKELEDFAKENDVQKLHEMLQDLDYETAQKVHPNNVVRVIRCIEIIKTLNATIGDLQRKYVDDEFDIDFIGLNYNDRNKLYARINQRVDEMLENGLFEEAKTLFEKYGKTNSYQNTIGYQEFIPFFEAQTDMETTIELIKQHTRNYAKRQISLLKTIKKINWQEIK